MSHQADNKAEYAAIISNRENLYRFLGRIYKMEIDQILFDQIKGMCFPTECSEAELGEGYRLVQDYLQNPGGDPLNDLAVDYARVFIGAGIANAAAAYPYESVYTSSKGLMMQEARDQVLEIYRANGLSPIGEFNEPEDHIAFGLEFMAHLCRKAQADVDKGDWTAVSTSCKEQLDFLTHHFLNWTPAFCADIEKYAETKFYKSVAKITKGYLRLESSILKELIAESAIEA